MSTSLNALTCCHVIGSLAISFHKLLDIKPKSVIWSTQTSLDFSALAMWNIFLHLCQIPSRGRWETCALKTEFQRRSISLLLCLRFLPCLCWGWGCLAQVWSGKVWNSTATRSCISQNKTKATSQWGQMPYECLLKIRWRVIFSLRKEMGNQNSWTWNWPAAKSWWWVGTDTGCDTGGDGGGDWGGSTRGGLCWCYEPVLLEVPTWHSQLLQR